MTAAAPTTTSDTRIADLFAQQQAYQYTVARSTAKARIRKLKRLLKAVMQHRTEIQRALYQDFRKPPEEVDLVETFIVTGELKHAIRNLRRWMRPQRVSTPPHLIGSRSYVQHDPKGVCLLISPWNFPLNLTLGPLVGAIAAGNCVIIKPSEHTPHIAALMQRLIESCFEPREIAMVQGDAEVAKTLLDLPFNHIFFTGAPAIGKLVMRAAAKHLASVTLELGGKSPTIIDETADLAAAADRIVQSKWSNAGQICIAPDYVLVHKRKEQALVAALRARLEASFGEQPQASPAYARMVNGRHFERVAGYLEDARQRGAAVPVGGAVDAATDYIAPTLITGAPDDSQVMTEEIFGPLLPIKTYRTLDEAIDYVNAGAKPLALYVYSKRQKHIDRVLQNTRSGGVCINHSAMHFYNNHLPFGGAGNSGSGSDHGWYGFETFSNRKSVYRQLFPGPTSLLAPPYNGFKRFIIEQTLRWF